MRLPHLLLATPLLCLVPLGAAPSQDDAVEPDPLEAVLPLVGRWQGEGVGPSGKSDTVLIVERVLGDRFVHMRTRAEFRPDGAAPDSEPTEVHEDWGMVSHDSGADVVRLRQWHVVGFVNSYALDREPAREGWTSFTSTAIENFAPGWRARWSYRITAAGKLEQNLELAQPQQDWFVCNRATLQRAD